MKRWIVIVFCLGAWLSCENQKQTNTGPDAAGEKELLYGIRLGMPMEEFYDYCWKRNQEGFFHDGGAYQQVMVEIDEGFSHPVQYFFLSLFDEKGELTAQKCKFRYKNWAPWNEDTHNDKLIQEVLGFLEPHFGDDFEQMGKKKGKELYYEHKDAQKQVEIYTVLLDDTYVYMDVSQSE